MSIQIRSIWNAFRQSPHAPKWLTWAAINVSIAAYFGFGLVAPASISKTAWLPGETTHGHYQIEMDCNACHDPGRSADGPSGSDVMQDACIRCHGEQLDLAKDTHPAKKFRDPTNAERLAVLDAQNCLSCHQEHVPEQTLTMGLTMPADYCWHCHQEVADSRPSHRDMAYDSCATAGCHNYHDNRALYEKYLDDHHGQPDHLKLASLPLRSTAASLSGVFRPDRPLGIDEADHPPAETVDQRVLDDWATTAHALAGVNCTHCHGGNNDSQWSETVAMESCQRCHAGQVASFQTGKHGMRLAVGLPAMTPDQARLPMHAGRAHAKLDCNACHPGHRFDTQFAAAEACLRCHADDHSLAYRDSSHATLWQDELSGSGAVGSGVSCATCHLPRIEGETGIWVNHDQNASLRPNETMARQVCTHCHGLEYSLSALADPRSITSCFGDAPTERIKSVQMARAWFEQRRAKRETLLQTP
ncbi:cytochrome c3 family protein [Stieleria sp. ICT_E10.1]|uniref:cytochrome c3 family protein n=1 Tax=Stieleria sedimenti TaxID=2976331 RepID=UPI00217F8056|nr:cytochrome c3 family protein [Stieleria sedimenti]MCS7468088.1 cytochrome c3 family protein [Stieleria sedimenti]